MILKTKRLVLREMTQEDFPALCNMLQDPEVMYAYEHAFSNKEAQEWLDKQICRYKQDGFGLWGMFLASNENMIGQCGLTWQDYHDKNVLEVGYLLCKKHWHKGYATEAAIACKEYAFRHLNTDEVYSIIRDTNTASQNVALRNKMMLKGNVVKHYYHMDMPHLVYSVKASDR